ncbi:unnamed protein product, partial [Anisakis simplex]|uniref:Uncharacterized protein n=1 Tax=Anisakis simplex TaxID=6269 RepID=A0A0M3KJN0_ANISI
MCIIKDGRSVSPRSVQQHLSNSNGGGLAQLAAVASAAAQNPVHALYQQLLSNATAHSQLLQNIAVANTQQQQQQQQQQ